MKKRLFAVACACVMATGLCGGAIVASAEEEAPEEPTVTNYFRAPGMDNLLQGEETEYDFKTEGVRVVGHINGSVKAKKESDGNVYLELGKDGANAFWWSGINITEAGDYRVSMDVKHAEGWSGNSAFAGFRFWSSSIAESDIPWGVIINTVNSANGDTWTNVELTYTVSAAMVTGVDSIQFGYDADDDGNNFLMVDNIVIEYIVPDEGAPSLGEGETGVANWREEDGGDVTFKVDLKGYDLTAITNKETEEEYLGVGGVHIFGRKRRDNV